MRQKYRHKKNQPAMSIGFFYAGQYVPLENIIAF